MSTLAPSMAAPTIADITVRRLRRSLPRPWASDVLDVQFIAVTVTDVDGAQGHGVSWTPTIGGGAVTALLQEDITAFALNRSSEPTSLSAALWERLHEAGSGGITTIAAAGLDLALWDLAGRRVGRPTPELLGIRHESVTAYGSGVNRHYSTDDLAAQCGRWVDAGFGAVKVKVGGRSLREDAERLTAVRSVIGPNRRLMIDANQLWTQEEAVEAVNALEIFDLTWIEEPLRADDLPGYAALRDAISVPIAAGENLHTHWRFREYLRAGAVDVIQPNVIRVGGISPFFAIADVAAEFGAEVHPHLLPEISTQLAVTLPGEPLVEIVEDASLGDLDLLAGTNPIEISGDRIRLSGVIGLGLACQEER
ncbi:mandelate racemase/muconate lactonizing enzyme family protein [Rathayibacter sp. VKM Ac-2835]|uniref:mandelate racemase/muconate lactonizing enzyme family protein n=1 Tax=Rathayibacter sp. VKM Ac-2835 TaxID=2739043 RepID=UPI001566B87B|nr:mandelate racemase/muconate lactonizing enzyme family protein [Rathayibacter sp. VKM Ac-2835]NRG43039.1 mandelate racemase/muconate lactonizing enzyme family protein [Rathayibacter sp. VKM Ac-2835]